MLYRSWLFAVAFGLILLPVSGQAQGETDNEQGQAATHQEPAQTFSTPIRIVEDEGEAEARQRREAEARQHDKDDLIAQQGMNAATQAMNEATQRMAGYSLLSVVFIGIGTILLVWTLFETRKATISATDAATYARTANRPFLTPTNYRLEKVIDVVDTPQPPILWAFKMDILNVGGGPAFIESYGATHVIQSGKITGEIDTKNNPIDGRMFIRPDATRTFGDAAFHLYTADDPDTWAKIQSCAINLYIVGYIQYTDNFGCVWESGFCLIFIPNSDSGTNLAITGPNSLWFDREKTTGDKDD